jgi:dipeptidyl aminopeptidase/acylaminoacyl peptidase
VIADSILTETKNEEQWKKRLNLYYIYCRQNGLWPLQVSGHNPEDESEWFDLYQPLKSLDVRYPPTLLLHGEKDTDVPFEQSQLMDSALAKNHIPHKFIHNAEWGHVFDGRGLDDPEIKNAFEQVRIFLNKYVK